MRVFVTGGSGYIGSVACRLLRQSGHSVAVYDDFVLGHREALADDVTVFQADLRDSAALKEAIADYGPDAVMHFGALALVGESMAEPERYFSVNVVGGQNLLNAMVANGVKRLIFSSTCATYGIPDSLPITEATPQHPVNPYGESKRMFERMIYWYAQRHGLITTIFRYFNAAGAWDELGEHHEPETHLIPNVLKVAMGQTECVEVFGADYETPDGTCLRDYVHVRDLATAHLLALERAVEGCFNLSTGEPVSVKEVIDTAERVTKVKIPRVFRPRRHGDPPILYAQAALAATQLGWSPVHSDLGNILESAWKWHSEHPNGYAG